MNDAILDAILQFQDILPKHKCGLHITHNQHRDYYESATEYSLRDLKAWKSQEARERAIATDEIWEIQWYPDTPVGFHRVCAPTLAEAIELAQNAALNAR